MVIQVNAQSISRRKAVIHPVKMELNGTPGTLRELIGLCVAFCVEQHNRRQDAPQEQVLSPEQMDDLAMTGKIAFGLFDKGAPVKPEEATQNALQSFEDGLYRVFLNGQPIATLDAPLNLNEHDTLTFIRLTMLAGRVW